MQTRLRLSPRFWDHCYFQTAPAKRTFDELSFLFGRKIRILDVGCGEKVYESLFDRAEYIGLDRHPRESRADVVGDTVAIPFAANSFDLIVCSEVLEHVYPIENAIAELRRVCKPGGYLYISTPFIFPIHDRSHDFYRYTRLFYRQAFAGCEFLAFRDANCAYSIPLILINRLLHHAIPSRWMRPLYFVNNALIYAVETLAGRLAPFGRHPDVTEARMRAMPAAYSMVIRSVDG